MGFETMTLLKSWSQLQYPMRLLCLKEPLLAFLFGLGVELPHIGALMLSDFRVMWHVGKKDKDKRFYGAL